MSDDKDMSGKARLQAMQKDFLTRRAGYLTYMYRLCRIAGRWASLDKRTPRNPHDRWEETRIMLGIDSGASDEQAFRAAFEDAFLRGIGEGEALAEYKGWAEMAAADAADPEDDTLVDAPAPKRRGIRRFIYALGRR